jgi:hypothetical protein
MTLRMKIAAVLMTVTAAIYGVVPLLVDLSVTHVLHPAWTPHARFHTVWQLSVNSMLAALVLILVWWPSPNRIGRLRVASVLGLIALGGFVIASLTRGLYGGDFSEPGGVPPVGGMDANVVAFTPTIALQLLALILAFLPWRTAPST